MKIERSAGWAVALLAAGFFCAAAAEDRDPVRGAAIAPASVDEILRAVTRSGKPVVLLNVWATWCVPCLEELPDILRLGRELEERGLAVMLVSADFDSDRDVAARFLALQGVDFPSFLKTGDDMEFIERLNPAWSGALPASFVFDGSGELRHFHEGKATYEAFRTMVLDVLEPGARKPPKE